MNRYTPMLKALRHGSTGIEHGKGSGMLSLRSISNKTIQICIQIVWPTAVPALIEEDTADLAGIQLVPQVDVGLDL